MGIHSDKLHNLDLKDQTEILCEKFEKGIKDGFGAIIIMFSIKKHGKASSLEIRKDLMKIFKNKLDYQYTSLYRLIGKLRDEFKLIEVSTTRPSRGPDRIYYSLTVLGSMTLETLIERYIKPLSEISIEQ